MKRITEIPLIAVMAIAAIFFAGCEKESGNEVVDTTPVKAHISSVIDKMTSRAAGTAWAKNDRIGITATKTSGNLCTNAPYVTLAADGTFTPEGEVFYFQDKEEVTFTAYYPFTGTDGTRPGTNGVISKTITAADQAPDVQTQIDYLFAQAKGSSAQPEVQFQFNHAMSRIELHFLPGTGVLSLSDIEYTIDNLRLAGTFDTNTGVATVDATVQEAPLTLSVSGNNADELTSALILFPQQKDAEVTLSVTMKGVNYSGKFYLRESQNNNNIRELAAGYNYIYNVKLNKETITIESAGINDWKGKDDSPKDVLVTF